MINKNDFEKPRWLYRFDNFERAFLLLREVMQIIQERKLSPLEQEGVIQRFEYTWELTWKVLKDYLEYSGIVFDIIAPRSVIKEAIAAKVIDNGDIWMDALDSRNKMSHTYSYKDFEKIITSIEKNYYPELNNFYLKMLKISTKIDSNRRA
jgi:nucleotidyltransferase substrate binding protein (TIGR01987 family)